MFVMPGGFAVSSVKIDVLSGITVAFALVPEAVAFAFVAAVDAIRLSPSNILSSI